MQPRLTINLGGSFHLFERCLRVYESAKIDDEPRVVAERPNLRAAFFLVTFS